MSVQTSHRDAGEVAAIRTAIDSSNLRQLRQTHLTRLSAVFQVQLVCEFLVVAASTYLASIIYHKISFGMLLPALQEYTTEALFIAALFTIVSLGFRHFHMAQRQQLHLHLWNGVGAVAFSFTGFLTAIFLLKMSTDFSRGAFIFQVIGVGITVCISRAFSHLWLRSAFASGRIEARRAILIGDPAYHSRVANELNSGGIRLVNSLPFPHHSEIKEARGDGQTIAQNESIRKLGKICRSTLPDDIVILATQKDLSQASDLAHYLSTLPCDVHISPIDDVRFLTRSQMVDLGSVITLRLARKPLSLTELVVKRACDIVIAILAIVALSPLLVTVALAIKLDSRGNILFRQLRHGYNNRIIRIYKFRSMAADKNANMKFMPTKENDERITAVGQILRRTNIDELPQLFNVLTGEMSIVGPRPHATQHNEIFEEQILPFSRRHNVKPGITGWAQVNGYRGPADTLEVMQRRVDYDLYYIDNWSFFFDLKILLMTLFSKKAYVNAL
jgi:Undecaprenyl-phosphate glucose phosphotransferase